LRAAINEENLRVLGTEGGLNYRELREESSPLIIP
jgi:hypothetical protein